MLGALLLMTEDNSDSKTHVLKYFLKKKNKNQCIFSNFKIFLLFSGSAAKQLASSFVPFMHHKHDNIERLAYSYIININYKKSLFT